MLGEFLLAGRPCGAEWLMFEKPDGLIRSPKVADEKAEHWVREES